MSLLRAWAAAIFDALFRWFTVAFTGTTQQRTAAYAACLAYMED